MDRSTTDRVLSPWPAQSSSPGTPLNVTRPNIEYLIAILWARRWVFSLVAILSVAALVSWAFLARPVYQVTVTLIPQKNSDMGGAMQSLLGGLSGGADMIGGLDMMGQGNDQEGIALLNSRSLFETFAARENLLPTLYSRDWNSAEHRWRDAKHVHTMGNAWKRFDHKMRDVDMDKQTGVVKFELSWTNRQQAAAWANELVKMANIEMQQRALQQAQVSLRVLQDQIQTTRSVEMQDAISRVMEMQLNKEVMASGRPDYAFAVMDPAVVPDADNFKSPKRGLILLVAVPVGFILGMVAVFVLDAFADLRRTLKRVRSGDPQRHDD
jgi:uncharacterized protein involved in exopolysaccharide biosynthesis